MKLTVTDLNGACASEIEHWRELFGSKFIQLTMAFCTQHPEINYTWIAEHLFSGALRSEYIEKHSILWNNYQNQHEPLQVDFECQRVVLQAGCDYKELLLLAEYRHHHIQSGEYGRQLKSLWADHGTHFRSLQDECGSRYAIPRNEYERQRAILFGALAERA